MDLLTIVSVMRNERTLIDYFIRWYSSVADRIVIYDGGSDDGTREIAKAHPKVELRDYPFGDELDDDNFTALANEEYKRYRNKSHWVALVDADEFLFHHDLIGLLKTYWRMGVTFPSVQGYSMVSRATPTTKGQIFQEFPMGVPDNVYSKPICINPQVEIAYGAGKHAAQVGGWVVRPMDVGMLDGELKLLHYRCLGLEYLRARRKRNFSRASKANIASNYGFHDYPDFQGYGSDRWFEDQLERAANVIHPVGHTSVHGWFDFPFIHQLAVDNMRDHDQAVEVGCWLGASTIHLAKKIIESGKKVTLHAIDNFNGTGGDAGHAQRLAALQRPLYESFMDNITNAGTKYVTNVIRSDSVAAAKNFANGSLGFCFLDADHRYEGIKSDISAWLPKMRPGAVFSGHDLDQRLFPGVHHAVHEAKVNIKAKLNVVDSTWFFKLPG